MTAHVRAALAAALLAATAAAPAAASPLPKPPATRVDVVRDTLFGDVIEDPYRWLEDKDSPETRQWVRDQMAFTRQQLGAVPGREVVVEALAKLSKVDARSLPSVRADQLFFTARRADEQQAVLMMRTRSDGPDVVLVDPNPLSPDHTTSVALLDVSLDGKLVAYGLRKGGEDETDVHLLNVETHKELADVLPKARRFGFQIDAAKQGAWYARWKPEGSRVWYHRFGDDPAKDQLVYGDKLGPSEIPSPALSEDGKWLLIGIYVGSSGDDTRWLIRPADKGGAFTSITDTLHASVSPSFAGDKLVIQTNWNAPNGRVMIADIHQPALKHWKEIIPERSDAVIEGVSTVAGKVVVQYLRRVASELAVFGLDGVKQRTIALPGIGSATAPAGEWAGRDAYYSFVSFNVPTTLYRYDAATGESREWWHSPVPFDGSRYEVHQFTCMSKDGTKLPLFVVSAKGIQLDGSHPTLLTGYGGFNVSETPRFSNFAAAWLDMGGVYVLATLRGGSEFGENWHRAGMRANKQHTFDDFLAAAQFMVSHGYCYPNKLAIQGGSNGGLLVGAAMTQQPDLFGAVVCQVPLLDMLRFHRFLVARFWVPEYGSAETAEGYSWLKAYSPYQHVKPGTKYPAVLFVTGDSDTRVDPLHARKMAALMQAAGSDKPVLLHYDVTSGHSGGQSVDKGIEDSADILQFLRGQLGMTTPN